MDSAFSSMTKYDGKCSGNPKNKAVHLLNENKGLCKNHPSTFTTLDSESRFITFVWQIKWKGTLYFRSWGWMKMSKSCNSLQKTARANLNPNRLPSVFLREGFFSSFLVEVFSTSSSGPLSSSNSLSLSLYSSSSLWLLLSEFLIKIKQK